MKKKFSILLCLTLCITMLAGCMGIHSDTKINEDGSGTISISVGLSEAALNAIQEMDGTTTIDTSTPFTLNGKTYYGETESYTFSSVEEFNTLMNEATTDDGEDAVKTGEVTLSKEDGKLVLNIKVFADTGNTDDLTADLGEDASAISPALTESIENDIAMIYDFEFPYNVIQSAGPVNGVTLSGHKLSLNLMDMRPVVDTELVYTFFASPEVAHIEIVPPEAVTDELPLPIVADPPVVQPLEGAFSDVSNDAWYYDAVNAAAEAGFVNGVGDGTFDPTGRLTYAAFCQILAKATGRPTGARNDYWAYEAIKSCVDNGWITTDKEITAENFDVPIEREIAFGAAALARSQMAPYSAVNPDYPAESIPDLTECSAPNGAWVLMAYRFGLTKGVDAEGNFNPHGLLTRAEVCQMFYNVDWLSPL